MAQIIMRKGLLSKIVDNYPVGANSQKYYHWDEIRHRRAPDGLTREEWWAAMKLTRRSASRPIPLMDIGQSIHLFAAGRGSA
ncbi:hypothetical protein [Nonomuraea cavernae]|uniref:hypothetical protein n=1 Tax=Nonomuraea cavernae TaxID=2045107 RepID=UPI001E4894AE|nr:hypothetical protein [Nonomuraea cavernae]MCA2189678.1 hypothetical protein [Nonomuraea cavernae]